MNDFFDINDITRKGFIDENGNIKLVDTRDGMKVCVRVNISNFERVVMKMV